MIRQHRLLNNVDKVHSRGNRLHRLLRGNLDYVLTADGGMNRREVMKRIKTPLGDIRQTTKGRSIQVATMKLFSNVHNTSITRMKVTERNLSVTDSQ